MNPLRWLEIDLDAIANNTRAVRKLVGAGVGLSAVVKADAYGHGAPQAARAALANGADALAVTYLEEALELRRAKVSAPCLVMGAVLPEDAAVARRANLQVMVDGEPLIAALEKNGTAARPVPVQVKVNLGLYRWGVALKDAPALIRRVQRSRRLRLAGVFAHPGYMIGKNKSRVEEELSDFVRVVKPLAKDAEIHAADSAVLLDFPDYRLSRVRVGNLLYGINPTDKPLALKNPWRAFARIVHVQRLEVGEMVGYGGEFVATQAMTVGTVPAGYAHGLSLEPASRWIQLKSGGQGYWGMLRGKKCFFIGRVGMSHCLVDLSAVPDARVGDAIQLPLRRTASSNWEKTYIRSKG